MKRQEIALSRKTLLKYSKIIMTVEERILECVRELPPQEREKVREFAESLQSRGAKRTPLRRLEGLWEKYDFILTDEDIDEARREMWGNFPREF